MSDKDPVTTVHEKDYFHGNVGIEISSTPAKDGVTAARLSFTSGGMTVDIPITELYGAPREVRTDWSEARPRREKSLGSVTTL